MKVPGFYLNFHSRSENVPFESHDPSMMYDPLSGWCYSYATDTAITSEYRQGIPVRKSRDLITFEFVGYALSEQAVAEARNNGDFPPTRGFWAPYVEYCNGEYRMYYSATKAFGSSESRIWMAAAKHPEGPFENRGIVIDTWGTMAAKPNAIDPHVVDTADGRKFLIYGSFFGGIFIKELNVETGLPLDGNIRRFGRRIARKPDNFYIDGPEGASVIRVENKYFLFLSYGWLGDDYDIRVGVSDSVEGPYVDREGKCLDGASYGQKLAGSYCFTASAPYAKEGEGWSFEGFRGPGHGVPFYHEAWKQYFFVHHIRDGAKSLCIQPKRSGNRLSYRMHYMMVRRMYFVEGWPVLVPEAYAEEPEAVTAAESVWEELRAAGTWEQIEFSNLDNHMVYSRYDAFPKDMEAGIYGTAFDFENSGECQFVSGYLKNGNTVWLKRRKDDLHGRGKQEVCIKGLA